MPFAQSLSYFPSCQLLIISSVQSWDTGFASQVSLQIVYQALSTTTTPAMVMLMACYGQVIDKDA